MKGRTDGGRRATGAALVLLASACAAAAAHAAPSWELPPHQQREGVFWRVHWYERGWTNGAPFERRLRINAAETSLHPVYGRRREARENGLLLLRADEDLFQITAAEFQAEYWGGHPGSAHPRVTVNGRATYALPRVGTEDGHCTASYPVLRLRVTDLVSGMNAFQWALDQGTTFWGHALVNQACLRVALTNGHTDLVRAGLEAFTARVAAQPAAAGEGLDLRLADAGAWADRIARVDYQGWYHGYDENGNGRGTDWHGFTRDREPVAYLGSAAAPPFGLFWDTAMLPAQADVAVRAFIHFRDAPGLVYVTAATPELAIPERPGETVQIVHAADLPAPFWSRADRPKTCTIRLPWEPGRIRRAELHVVTWTGGAGTVRDYFTLNGRPLPVAEGHAHAVQWNRIALEPGLLRAGVNEVVLRSDTVHHGIEVFLPSPALVIRTRDR